MLDLRGVTWQKTGGCGEHVERGSSLEREKNTLSDDDDDDDCKQLAMGQLEPTNNQRHSLHNKEKQNLHKMFARSSEKAFWISSCQK